MRVEQLPAYEAALFKMRDSGPDTCPSIDGPLGRNPISPRIAALLYSYPALQFAMNENWGTTPSNPALVPCNVDTTHELEIIMNWDQIEGKWKQLKGQAQAKWGDITDDEWDKIEGRREQLVGLVQERYGHEKAQAEREIDGWLKTL